MNPKTVEELYKQEYIRDASMTVSELIKSVIGKLGENITLREFIRYEI
jgi:elongation factor Ts